MKSDDIDFDQLINTFKLKHYLTSVIYQDILY